MGKQKGHLIENVICFFSLFVLSMFFYSFQRLCFFLNNFDLYENSSIIEILYSFIHGLRFDASSILTIGIIHFLISISGIKSLSDPSSRFRKWFVNTWLILQLPLFLFNMVDVEYIKFSGRRTDLSVLNMASDLSDQFFQLLISFLPYFILLIVTAYLFVKLTLKVANREIVFKPIRSLDSFYVKALFSFSLFLFVGLLIRGGLQTKPLSSAHAYTDPDANLGTLTLNSTFTVLKTNFDGGLVEPKLINYEKAKEILKAYSESQEKGNLNLNRPNIILVILESFSTEYLGLKEGVPSYTPFLNQLSKESVYYPNFFANGRRSIEAIPSMIFSMPNFLREPFINTKFRSNRFKGIGVELKKNGYESYFFHGGKKGTMFFDVMASKAGIENYVGMEEYPNNNHFDGAWGIYDHNFLDFTANYLDTRKSKTPFFATIFTLSSHNPYKVPPEIEKNFESGTLPIHKAIRYTDFSLRKFFEQAESMPWFENSVFIITADHASALDSKIYKNELGRYMVPLLIYDPKNRLPRKTHYEIAHQLDIAPTILSLSGFEDNRLNLFGRNLLSSQKSGAAFFRNGALFKLVSKQATYTLDLNTGEMSENRNSNKVFLGNFKSSDDSQDYRLLLEAAAQYHHSSLLHDSF